VPGLTGESKLRLWARTGRQVDRNNTVSCLHQFTLPLYDRFHKRRIPPERRKDAIPHVWKIVRIKRQSGNSANIDVEGCRLTERCGLGCIDQKVLPRSAPAFKCDPGSRVDDDREPLVLDSPGAQTEHNVRRRSGSGCLPEGEVAADIISGLHPLREKLADVG
jgi:hypothetical protein